MVQFSSTHTQGAFPIEEARSLAGLKRRRLRQWKPENRALAAAITAGGDYLRALSGPCKWTIKWCEVANVEGDPVECPRDENYCGKPEVMRETQRAEAITDTAKRLRERAIAKAKIEAKAQAEA